MKEVKGILRQSKDTICNARGRKQLELCDSFGLRIQNGTSLSDCEGNHTFCWDQGASVIDYAILGEDWETFVKDFEIKEIPYSDHFPVVVNFQWLNEETS